MAKPNFSFQKRQRELEKQKKKEQKIARKQERKEAQTAEDATPADGDEPAAE